LPLPEGTRKFIIATNIAETSITIPNIRYVIDSGQEKHRYFDKVWKWKKGWGSKAMAEQRSGRAGRTAHGYCYRLYSAALYANIMEQFSAPEILKQPLDSTILQLKAIGIENVYTFPFPTKPEVAKISHTL
jgi:ATP-dependent RNA helicase DHX37/DHR1